jgi:hypothetical protein
MGTLTWLDDSAMRHLSPNLLRVFGMLFQPKDTAIRIIAHAYCGYWKSPGRASQRGLEIDIAAVLVSLPSSCTSTILWGQSLGYTVPISGLAEHQRKPNPTVAAIPLETPFTQSTHVDGVVSAAMAAVPVSWSFSAC